VWGQFTVLDRSRLPVADRAAFEALPESDVVPDFEVLSENAHGELAPDWVAALDEGWRRHVLGGAR
jgi:putative spermidine/putrescine transport system substrate-binding protein